MIYKMINNARDRWFASNDCTVNELVNYMIQVGEMRSSQIDAIKTYLFLKIKCDNKPLWQLMTEGVFNEALDLSNTELRVSTRAILESDTAAMALYQYSCLKDGDGIAVFDKLNKEIKSNTENIDFRKAIKSMFNNISFTDYIFSLPMGAGKTYLMAAFIYLDLYFAMSEPTNKAFAHNFIICAPSGLKSSVIPSLRSIKDFDATWVLPSAVANQVKQMLKFEVLDEDKTQNKSNKIKNPNVQKISTYQPFEGLMGLVLVTNAEKVILDNIKLNKTKDQPSLEDTANNGEINELKKIVAKIPNLGILVDEVHHLADENIKLNAVVEYWHQNGDTNCLLGFSGTPYYNKKQPIAVSDTFTYGITQIPFIVNHYPLINAIEDFLKTPQLIKTDNRDYLYIVENGVKAFLDKYLSTVYSDETCAKVAIYCGRIARLREEIYPLCRKIAQSYGLNPDEAVLCYHGEDKDKKYTCSASEKLEFGLLDTKISKVRIILLAQIGKEGWNCKSLTGVVLSQKGDCPKNMILQTACRCLRQVDKNNPNETALIYLNDYNYSILDAELSAQQHTSIEELNSLGRKPQTTLDRYDRSEQLQLPAIEMCQLKVTYEGEKLDDKLTVEQRLKAIAPQKITVVNTVIDNIANRENVVRDFQSAYGDEHITYTKWLADICKESFDLLKLQDLMPYDTILKALFDTITISANGCVVLNKLYDNDEVKSQVRKAFQDKYAVVTKEELVKETKLLINKANFTPKIVTDQPTSFYPDNDEVQKIIAADTRNSPYTEEQQKQIKILVDNGMENLVKTSFSLSLEVENRNRTFHYLPYNFSQSGFEKKVFKDILTLSTIEKCNLEIYYIGDRALTEFHIRCYKKVGAAWYYIGLYTPDFLIVERKHNKITKVLMVETKGRGYAKDKNFIEKKEFVQTKFLEINSKRFDYFYIEDDEKEYEADLEKLNNTIKALFEEE